MPKTAPFEKYSDAYEHWFEKNSRLYAAEVEAVRQLMPGAGGEALEVGVGTGKFALPLGIAVGVEPSEQMAAKASARGISVYSGTAEALPFADGRFDGVLMVTTICFVDDPAKAIEEAFRVLKPGGCLIIGFVDKESELGRQYEKNREKSRFYKDAVFFSSHEIWRLMREAGFRVGDARQAIIAGEPSGTVWQGCGQGSFVAVKGVKQGV